ncbi:hypothetical protein CDD82_4313 [Ophiocordyceps australis]|uniref:Uncharacterized protein n=1 Tax=Ophiocordyceps australis TaxID=1399860 RepID=A0A2C5YCB8_9HYPO|nr:hypothetical protein CDD82_4313 [Ophiocordyceps australis]
MASKPAFALLEAFGSPSWFRDAFNWEQDDIYKWMEKASNGEEGGAATKDPEIQKLLAETLKNLKLVALPNGAEYKNPRAPPDSHFYRKLNPKFTAPRPVGAKFDVREWTLSHRGQDAKTRSCPWWNPYDLLGHFLSLLGPAPQTANRNTFFLPLTAVYARWCSCIAGHKPDDFAWTDPARNGAGDWPFMYQCTWRSDGHKTNPRKWFFLGASTGGDDWKRDVVGPWKYAVQRQRFNMMMANLRMTLLPPRAFQDRTAPEQNGGSGATWGNCAETYPFVFSVFPQKPQNSNLYGLALSKNFMRSRKLTAYDEYRGKGTWNFVIAPCRNCSALLSTAGANEAFFARTYEWDDAPEKPKSLLESAEPVAVVKEAAAKLASATKEAAKLVSGPASSSTAGTKTNKVV